MALYSSTASTFRYLSRCLEELGHPIAFTEWQDSAMATKRLGVTLLYDGVPILSESFQAYDETVMYNEANAWLAKQVSDLRSWK